MWFCSILMKSRATSKGPSRVLRQSCLSPRSRPPEKSPRIKRGLEEQSRSRQKLHEDALWWLLRAASLKPCSPQSSETAFSYSSRSRCVTVCIYSTGPAGCFKQHAQMESLPPGCVSCSSYASAARSLHWQGYHQQSKAVARAAEEQEKESNKQKTNKVRTARICCNCITHGTLLIASRHTLNCGRL